jgi:hypothetical protein
MRRPNSITGALYFCDNQVAASAIVTATSNPGYTACNTVPPGIRLHRRVGSLVSTELIPSILSSETRRSTSKRGSFWVKVLIPFSLIAPSWLFDDRAPKCYQPHDRNVYFGSASVLSARATESAFALLSDVVLDQSPRLTSAKIRSSRDKRHRVYSEMARWKKSMTARTRAVRARSRCVTR